MTRSYAKNVTCVSKHLFGAKMWGNTSEIWGPQENEWMHQKIYGTHHIKNSLEFSGCRTRRNWRISTPAYMFVVQIRNRRWFWDNSTNQTKDGCRDRNSASKKLRGRDAPSQNAEITLGTPRTPLFTYIKVTLPCFCWTKPLKMQQKRSSWHIKCDFSIFGRRWLVCFKTYIYI